MAKVIILSGAGISAESGISTFRDEDGLWENHKIEDICVSGCLDFNRDNTIKFYDMLRKNLKDKEPNKAHKIVAELKNKYPNDIAVITQNVDDMFEKAGCKGVIHLHGFLQELRCTKCKKLVNIGYERSDILYNQDNCVDYDSPLALSEGIIDSIYVGRVVPQAVATLSNKILKDHEAFISKFKTVYVFPDNDASENGLFLIKTLIPLMAKCDIKVAVLPKQKKDAALCSVQELQEAYDNAAPIREFIVSPRYFRFLELISQKNKKPPVN